MPCSKSKMIITYIRYYELLHDSSSLDTTLFGSFRCMIFLCSNPAPNNHDPSSGAAAYNAFRYRLSRLVWWWWVGDCYWPRDLHIGKAQVPLNLYEEFQLNFLRYQGSIMERTIPSQIHGLMCASESTLSLTLIGRAHHLHLSKTCLLVKNSLMDMLLLLHGRLQGWQCINAQS